MFPWMTIWAPHLNLPWSGSVAQRIEPTTIFDFIDGNGDSRIERKAFEEASYGRQIGLITEVVLGLASPAVKAQLSPDAKESLGRLTDISKKIEGIKREEAAATANDIVERLKWLKKNDQIEYEALIFKLRLFMGGERT